MTKKKPITAFLGVFEQNLERMKKSIKTELERPSSERRRGWLKSQLKEAKELRNLLKGMSDNKTCPHCGGKI
jgi:hypothetical protein